MSLLDREPIARRTMHLFFIVDTSGSMRGAKIGAVNDAIRTTLPIVRQISDGNPDAEIKIAALNFSDGSEWLYNEPKDANDFEWDDQVAEGGTDLGEACRNIEKVLHMSNGWMGRGSGSFAPVFILLSDGGPTDDYRSGLKLLKENGWYKAGIKVAIAIGDDADLDVLTEFTGNIERVIKTDKVEALKKVIRTVTVTSSMVGSKTSSTTNTKTDETIKKEDQVAEQLKEEIADIDGACIGTDITNVPCNDSEFA